MAGNGGLDGWTARARFGFIFTSVASTECWGVIFDLFSFFFPVGKEKFVTLVSVGCVVCSWAIQVGHGVQRACGSECTRNELMVPIHTTIIVLQTESSTSLLPAMALVRRRLNPLFNRLTEQRRGGVTQNG